MIPALAVLIALACAGASAARLWFVSNATALHPDEMLRALGAGESIARLREVAERAPGADWERDLLQALTAKTAEERAALVNAQLSELDFRIRRWARVPRVCASIATSAGLLLATLLLRRGLADAGDLGGDGGEVVVRGLVGDALTVAAFGVVGTAFCLAAQKHARELARAHAKAADHLVERLEALVS